MQYVFIGGCPRSGTTMLAGEICKNYKNAVFTPESQFKTEVLRGEKNYKSWKSLWRLKAWGIQYEDVLNDFSKGEVDSLEVLETLVARYASKVGVNLEDNEEYVWIDHTPDNILYADNLLLNFEDAVVLHIVRDPRGVFNSYKSVIWGTFDPRETVEIWQRSLSSGLLVELDNPSRVLRVKYEDCVLGVSDYNIFLQEKTALVFREESVSLNDNLPRYTKSQHKLVGGSLEKSRTEAWRDELSEKEKKVVEHYGYYSMTKIGYEASGSGLSLAEKFFVAVNTFAEIAIRKHVSMVKYKLRNHMSQRTK